MLLVDDDVDLRTILEVNLVDAGFDVHVAGDGEAALRLLRAVRPDIVLLDIGLPGADGLTVLQQLRSEPDGAGDVPVVVVSGRTGDDHLWAGWRAGADSYITKPVDLRRLIDTMRRLLAAAV